MSEVASSADYYLNVLIDFVATSDKQRFSMSILVTLL